MREISVACKNGFEYVKFQDPGNSLHIKSYLSELENSRLEDTKSITKSVTEVRKEFETLKFEVSKLKEIQSTDFLKEKLFKIQEEISHLKETIKDKLLTLLKDEVNLSKDLQFMGKEIEKWGKPINIQVFKPIKRSNYKVSEARGENPTAELQKFLSSSGGRFGGWQEKDHLLFLLERTRHKGDKKFISAVQNILKNLSYEKIEEHERWYQRYEALKKFQKNAIQKWKMEKKILQKKDKEKKETKQEKKQVKMAMHQDKNIAERLKEWKNQQLVKKLEEEEKLKKENEKLKEIEKRKREKQRMKKLVINQYKAEKLKKAQEILPKEENTYQMQEAKARNKILLKAFRLQDLKFIQKKKMIRSEIESKANEKLKLAKPAIKLILHRNPQRIFQPTLIWSQHCLESQKREKLNLVFDLNSISRLAIPEWRKELKSSRVNAHCL